LVGESFQVSLQIADQLGVGVGDIDLRRSGGSEDTGHVEHPPTSLYKQLVNARAVEETKMRPVEQSLVGPLLSPAPVLSDTDTPGISLTLGATTVILQETALEGLSQVDLGPAGLNVVTASATARNPYREVTLTEVPYGAVDADDPALGPSFPGAAAGSRASLGAFRTSQGAVTLGDPETTLFGAQVTGAANLVNLAVDGPIPTSTVLVEWVTEAEGGLWLVRVAEGVGSPGTAAAAAPIVAQLADMTVAAGTVGSATEAGEYQPNIASQAATNGSANQAAQGGSGPVPPPVPTPSWWSGTCDTNDYSAAAQALMGASLSAYPLSSTSTWDGLTACGPHPGYAEGPDVSVLYPGAHWSVLEWECVELSMRWMYEEWNVEPYPANGSNVVWNYAAFQSQYNPDGPVLTAVANDGVGPMPVPGDVLSYGATSTAGHTSVVTGTNIDADGDGTVTVLEQNASATGWDTVTSHRLGPRWVRWWGLRLAPQPLDPRRWRARTPHAGTEPDPRPRSGHLRPGLQLGARRFYTSGSGRDRSGSDLSLERIARAVISSPAEDCEHPAAPLSRAAVRGHRQPA